MKAQRILLVLFLLAIQSAVSFAQLSVSSKYPARKSGFWSLGINAGSAYQTSDVERLYQGWGAGLTLGKNLYYRPKALFSFDVRGRFLYDVSYGLDTKRSYGIKYNNALNGTYDSDLNYLKPNGNGYVFANHKTTMGELGLEGVLTFNRFREKTGIVASVFGGIGINAYNVGIDQLKNANSTYALDYAAIDTSASKSTIRQQLMNTLNGYYNDSGDGNDLVQVGFMPSLGFELGYQFAPRFHASIGHRVTYSLRDNLDGQQWNYANLATGTNDRSNYTYLKLEWELTPINKCHNPEIEILSPDKNPYTTDQVSVRVSAKISNINNSLDVLFKLNGEATDFNFYNPRINQDVRLRPGRNEVEITATNNCGKDVKIIVINYIPPPAQESPRRDDPPKKEQPPVIEEREISPVVTITNPSYSPYTVENQDFKINATIVNVKTDRNVSFTQNGNTRNFDFNPSKGIFSANVKLQEGKNIFAIQARNNAGIANGETIIYYEIKEEKPTVSITNPSSEYTETYETYRNISAYTTNISRKNQITFLVNNRAISDFSFNENTGEITKNLNLNECNNLVRIEVKNNRASSYDETNLVRKRDVVVSPPPRNVTPPRVNITSPSQKRTNTFDNNISIQANIQYVDYQSDITFIVNGRRSTNFDFNRGLFTANVNLDEGNNTVTVKARNNDGEDEESVTIVKNKYIEPAPKSQRPEVTITNPRNGSKFESSSCTLEAFAKYVTSKNELSVTLNGNRIDFVYNPMGKKISATLNLVEGSNTIRIVAKNDGGSDEASTTVSYRRSIPAPKVNISKPANGSTTENSNTTLVASTQNVENKGDITVKLNGNNIPFNFSRGEVTANANLNEGNNSFSVSVKNEGGTDTKSVNVTYKKAIIEPRTPRTPRVETPTTSTNGRNPNNTDEVKDTGKLPSTELIGKPKIVITSLSQNVGSPWDPPTGASTLIASVKWVSEKSQITVLLNGKSVDFQYDSANETITSDFTLVKGENTIIVKATNRKGSTEQRKVTTF